MKYFLASIFFFATIWAYSQSVGINDSGTAPDPSALLDVDASGMGTKKGILIPRMSTAERDAIPAPADGLLVFNMDCGVFQYWFNGTWIPFPTGQWNSSFPQNVTANANPNPVCEFGTLNLTGSAANPFPSGSNSLTWSWTGPNGFTSTDQNPVINNVPTAAAGDYYLTAYNSCGSNMAAVLTVAVDSIPPRPVNAAATGVTNGSFVAHWNWSTAAIAYYLDVATDANFSNIVSGYNDLNVGNDTVYTVTGLQNDQTYYYRVRAEGDNVCGQSVSSDTISVSTPICYPEGWTAKADLGGVNRKDAVGFSIGLQAYVGLGSNDKYLKDFWRWDQTTNTWTQLADFSGTVRKGSVSFVIGTDAYIGTGVNNTYFKDFYKYNSLTGTWSQIADFAGDARRDAVAFTINGKGYVGTGKHSRHLKDFWEYDPSGDTWTRVADFGGAVRKGATGFALTTTGKGYVTSGSNNRYYNDMWEYEPSTDTWTQLNDFAGVVRRDAVSFIVDTVAFVGAGANNSYLNDFWEYDHVNDAWISRAALTGDVRKAAVGFGVGPYGYVSTGSHNKYLVDLWEFCRASGS